MAFFCPRTPKVCSLQHELAVGHLSQNQTAPAGPFRNHISGNPQSAAFVVHTWTRSTIPGRIAARRLRASPTKHSSPSVVHEERACVPADGVFFALSLRPWIHTVRISRHFYHTGFFFEGSVGAVITYSKTRDLRNTALLCLHSPALLR